MLVNLLDIVRDTLKPQFLTVFVIDTEMQTTILRLQSERKQNYKKLHIGSQSILAIFSKEKEIEKPLFQDIQECSKMMICNKKHLLIPLGGENS